MANQDIFTNILPLSDDYMPCMQSEPMSSMENIEGITPATRTPPKKILVLKFGKTDYTQDGEDGSFEFTPDMAQQIIDEFTKRGKDLVIDYEHGTLNKEAAAQGKSPAAGWGGNLEVDPEKGLVLIIKNWTPDAYKKLSDGEYRYISPVVRFDKQTKKPAEIHSIALTNHPAIHKMEALVAANDDGNEVVKSYQGTVKSIKEGIDSMQELLESTIQEYSDYVKGTPEEAKMISFNDGLFGKQDIKAFADVTGIIVEKRNAMKGEELMRWLDEQIAVSTDEQAKAQFMAEKDRLTKFQSEFPELWQAGFTIGNADTLTLLQKSRNIEDNSNIPVATQPEPIPMLPMSDITTLVGVDNIDKAKEEIKALSDFRKTTDMFLSLHDVKSFEELDKKIKSKDETYEKEAKELKDKLALSDAEKVVSKAMDEGKITEAMKHTAIDLALKDIKMFNDWISVQPSVAPKKNNILAMSDTKPTSKLSKAEFAIAKSFKPSITTEEEALEVLGRNKKK